MQRNINLNIHYSAPDEIWDKISEVYQSMPYWAGDGQGAKWTGEHIDLWASVKPGGIQIAGIMPNAVWEAWYGELKAKLTEALGYEIGEPEDGYDLRYWE